MKKYIGVITGATGYVGSHLAKFLLDKGWEIHAIVRRGSNCESLKSLHEDLHVFTYTGDEIALSEYFRTIKPEVVFHLAAAVKNDNQIGDAESIINANILFGTAILEAMRYAGVRLFINTGTYWQNYNSDTYNPVNLYAATKEAFEKIIDYYVDAHGFRAITLRLYDIYGEDDTRPKLWNALRDIAGTDKSIDVSPGEQLLDIVHIDDICSAYETAYSVLVPENGTTNSKFGVRTGEFHTLKEWIAAYQDAVGKNINVNYGGKPYREREMMIPSRTLDILPNWKYKKAFHNMFSDVR